MREEIVRDRAAGRKPFLVVASAGTVDIGAIDDLTALAALCREEKLWFHVDGAFGALGILSPQLASQLAGIERADSIALDFHKWGQVPYDAGFLLVRDGERHRDAFAAPAAYLRREARGLAAGSPWPCDLGVDLSRGFRALKTWFTLKTYGTDKLGAVITRCCALADYLKARVEAEPRLELLASVNLNIVCFRYRADDADRVNGEIVVNIQESGIAAPSTCSIDGKLCIRVCITNHRTTDGDLAILVQAVLSAVLLLFGGNFRQLFTLSLFAEWLSYVTASSSLFVFKSRGFGLSAGFRTWGYPLAPALFIVASAALLYYTFTSNLRYSVVGSLVILAGIPVYHAFALRRRLV